MAGEVVTAGAGTRVGRAVCAIGVFDGVHLGHRFLIERTARIAREAGVRACAVTFDRDPDQVVAPGDAAFQLLTLADKTELLTEAGADVVLVVPFTPAIAALEPERFLTEVLLPALDPVTVLVGGDFRFGHRAAGDVGTLERFFSGRGVEVVACDLIEAAGAPVTSTRIRGLVAAGDVAGAARLLGRAHRVSGRVVRGRGEGTALGVPTANVAPVEFAALPAAGVYAGRAYVGTESWLAAISVGRPPTFPRAVDVLEVHLIGYSGDLTGSEIRVDFLQRLRDMRAFPSLDELKAAMAADIATVRALGGDIAGS